MTTELVPSSAEEGTTIMTGGFCFEIISALQKLYNFTYELGNRV